MIMYNKPFNIITHPSVSHKISFYKKQKPILNIVTT